VNKMEMSIDVPLPARDYVNAKLVRKCILPRNRSNDSNKSKQ